MNERLEYVQEKEREIQEVQEKLEQLKKDRDQAVETLQHEEIDRLEEHLDNARVNLKAISEVAGESWQELKEVVEKVLNELGEKLKRLVK
ncbi:MAG: hypothetical protein KC553_02895 [Nitrospina sp.]|nr:hypothetical protein [Nitrospina sp.]